MNVPTDLLQILRVSLPASPQQGGCSWTPSDQTPSWMHSKPPSRWSQGWRPWSSQPPFPATNTASACAQSLCLAMLVAGSKVVLTAREVGRGWGMLWLDQPGSYNVIVSTVILQSQKLKFISLLYCTSPCDDLASLSEAHFFISDSSIDLHKGMDN